MLLEATCSTMCSLLTYQKAATNKTASDLNEKGLQ
jgi:hypothetical protein